MIISKSYATLQKKMWDAGSTLAEVVEYFRLHGIQGVQQDENSCPFANYLTSISVLDHPEVDHVIGIQVGSEIRYAIFDPDVTSLGFVDHDIPVPRHVAEFIDQFDLGRYPDLIQEEDDEDESEDLEEEED